MGRQKTAEEFRKEFNDSSNGEYALLSDYRKSNERVMIKHIACGNIFMMTPHNWLSGGQRCPKCGRKAVGKKVANKLAKSPEQFRKEFFESAKNDYVLISDYINNHTKIKIKHLTCGAIFEMTPGHWLHGCRCPNCKNERMSKTKTKTTEEFKKEFDNISKGEYALLSSYNGYNNKIIVQHNCRECKNHIFKMLPSNFLQGERCPKCFGAHKKTPSEFEKEFYESAGEEYELLSKYQNRITKIKVKHERCGNTFETTPDKWIYGCRCPVCRESHGESKIRAILKKKRINFESQYRIDECRDKLPLPFDFAVLNLDGSINFLIEYDGPQHYKEIEYFGGEENFNKIKVHDKIKNDFCFNHNIDLLRISYKDDDKINSILDEELSKCFT